MDCAMVWKCYISVPRQSSAASGYIDSVSFIALFPRCLCVHEFSLCLMITNDFMLDDILISHAVNDKLGRTKIPRNVGCFFV